MLSSDVASPAPLQAKFRILSIKRTKPVSPAIPVLPLMESASPAGNFGNVSVAEFADDVAAEATLMESVIDLCNHNRNHYPLRQHWHC